MRTAFIQLSVLGFTLYSSDLLAQAVHVRFSPDEYVYLNEINGARGIYDVVIHNIAIVNQGSQVVTIERAWIDVLAGTTVVQRSWVGLERILRDTRRTTEAAGGEREVFLRMQLADRGGLTSFLGDGLSLASSGELAPGTAALAQRILLSFSTVPDRIEVHVTGRTPDGAELNAVGSLAVVQHQPSVEYAFPLEGTWFMRSIPSATSHHRWVPSTEFAVDFFKVDGNGQIRSGSREAVDNYYGYGEPVMAVAAGNVVAVEQAAAQDRSAWLRREGESRVDLARRNQAYLNEALAENFRRALAGNYVVIRHENGEYSAYGHLRTGSVRVDVDDHVDQGEVIGEVGDTGDSPAVHLHFSLNEGEGGDIFFSRGVPIRFSNLPRSIEVGRHVTPVGQQ